MRGILVLLALMFSQQYALAGHDERGEHGKRIAEELELTAEQSDAFRDIMQEQKSKRQEMFSEFRQQMKEQMQSLHDETRQKLTGVLTGEQLAKFDEMREKRMEKMKHRMQQRHEKHKSGRHHDEDAES